MAAQPKGPKSPPSVVQLPGGFKLKGFPFRVLTRDLVGRPLTFERVEEGAGDCTLWATEGFMNGKPR